MLEFRTVRIILCVYAAVYRFERDEEVAILELVIMRTRMS